MDTASTSWPPRSRSFFVVPNNVTPTTHGIYSTYASRLRIGETALILPMQMARSTKVRGSMAEPDSDLDEFFGEEELMSRGTPGAMGTPGIAATVMKKVTRQTRHIYPPENVMKEAAELKEVLIPIRLDLDIDNFRLRDSFTWNLNEKIITPEHFAELLCEDLELPTHQFVQPIATSIKSQVEEYEAVADMELPEEDVRVIINLDLQVGKLSLRDRFEWDVTNPHLTPEAFSRQLAADLGLGGEFVSIIAHSIHEQLCRFKKERAEEYTAWGDEFGSGAEPLRGVYRAPEDAKSWEPQLEMLTPEELEKIMMDRERSIRRLRRETTTRYKSSRRRP
ncbi:uncharacterized protein VTP21DRAFT_4469 [Calcarisporiella thermophila]|uniref:uncharacterized protein n=1 Tax=Calcarisporiella thermophila TaxID=911321 RepID=UPI0037448E76